MNDTKLVLSTKEPLLYPFVDDDPAELLEEFKVALEVFETVFQSGAEK